MHRQDLEHSVHLTAFLDIHFLRNPYNRSPRWVRCLLQADRIRAARGKELSIAWTSCIGSSRRSMRACGHCGNTSLVRGSLRDLVRTKPELIAENALLRQQLIVLNRN